MGTKKIYKIENLINHKIYIGKTIKSLDTRLAEHKTAARRWAKEELLGIKHPYNSRLYPAMNKWGLENFTIYLVEELPESGNLEEREQDWISKYNATDDTIGYNISPGGLGGPLFSGHRHSDLTKHKLKELGSKNIKLDRQSILKRKLPETNKFQNLETAEVCYSTEFTYRTNEFKQTVTPYKIHRYKGTFYLKLGVRRNEIQPLSLVECTKLLYQLNLYKQKNRQTGYYKQRTKLIKQKQQQSKIYWMEFIAKHSINPSEYIANYNKFKNSSPNKHLELIYKISYANVRGLNKFLGLTGGSSGHPRGGVRL